MWCGMRRNSSVNLGRRSTICGFFCCSTCYSNHTCGELNPAEYLLIERNLQGARAASFVALRATPTIRVVSLMLPTVCRLDEMSKEYVVVVYLAVYAIGVCRPSIGVKINANIMEMKKRPFEVQSWRITGQTIYKRPPLSRI